MDLYLWKHADNCLFQKIAVIDYAISVIWVRRFQEEGEFEIYLPASKELVQSAFRRVSHNHKRK